MNWLETNWIPVRQVRDILSEAGLFNHETPRALIARAKAGLMPIKAKRVTYETPPRGGSARDNFIFPQRMLEGLGFAELNIEERTIKSPAVREGNGVPMINFIAFDVEFGRAAVLDYAGCDLLMPVNASGVLASKRGRKPGDGSYDKADARFVDMILALKNDGEVTSALAGARFIVEKYGAEIKGSGESAIARLAARVNAKLRKMDNL